MDSENLPAQSSAFWLFQIPPIHQPHKQQASLTAPRSQQELRVVYSPYLPGHQIAVDAVDNADDKLINDDNYNDIKSRKCAKKDTLRTVSRNDTAQVKMKSVCTDGGLGGIVSGFRSSTKCPTCGKWFRSRQQLSQHMVVHTDERRYVCKYCSRTFKQPSHLHQHHRIHTGEKPYRCPLEGCTRAFPQQSNLNHHLRNHDRPTPPPENTCIFCNRIYASDAVLRNHLLKIHLCDHKFPPHQEKSNVDSSLSGSVHNRLKTGKSVLNNCYQLLDDMIYNDQNTSVNISHQNLNRSNEDISSKNTRTDCTIKKPANVSFEHTSFLDGRTTNNDDAKNVFEHLNTAKHDKYGESPFPVVNIQPSYLQSDKNEDKWTSRLNYEHSYDSNQTSDMGLQTMSLNKKVLTVFEKDEQNMLTCRRYTKLMEDLEYNTEVNISEMEQAINETNMEQVPTCNEHTNTRDDNHIMSASNVCYKNTDSFRNSKTNFNEHSVKEIHCEDNTAVKYKSVCTSNANDFVRNLINSNYIGVSINQTVLATIDVTMTSKASKRKAFRPQRIVPNQPLFLDD